MSISLDLPYGGHPFHLTLPSHLEADIVHPPPSPPPRPLNDVIARALATPIAAPRLDDAVHPGAHVVIVVSDTTRDDPRDAMVRALLARMPDDIRLTIAIANGTHGPCALDDLGIGSDIWSRATVINHDAHSPVDLVTIGTTRRGTPVRVHRCVVDADWVIATGRIKPHYFAGYGAGCKSIFPGLGANREIRQNHELKREPGARPGEIDENPCRQDLAEAISFLPSRTYLLNVVVDHDGGAQMAVAGDVDAAFRRGAEQCEPLFKVQAPRARLIAVSDRLPLTGSLYQASKLVAAAAELLLDGGTVLLFAECPEGTGPIATVNRAIYEIGLAPRLPRSHRIILISGLTRHVVETSYCVWIPDLHTLLEKMDPQRITVIPRAGSLIIEPV